MLNNRDVMFKPKRFDAKNYYVNLENDRFLLACSKESFKPEFQDNIPASFDKKNENTFVMIYQRGQSEQALANFKNALESLTQSQQINEELQAYISNTPRQRIMY